MAQISSFQFSPNFMRPFALGERRGSVGLGNVFRYNVVAYFRFQILTNISLPHVVRDNSSFATKFTVAFFRSRLHILFWTVETHMSLKSKTKLLNAALCADLQNCSALSAVAPSH